MKPSFTIKLLFLVGFHMSVFAQTIPSLNELKDSLLTENGDTLAVKKYLGVALKYKKDSSIAIFFGRKGYDLSKELGYKKGKANALRLLSFLEKSHGFSADLIENRFKEGIKINQEIGDAESEIVMIKGLIQLYMEEKKPDLVMSFFNQALKERKNDLVYTFHMYNTLGRMLKNTGEYGKGIPMLRTSYHLFYQLPFQTNRDSFAQYVNMRHLGVCFRELKEEDSCFYYLKECEKHILKMKDSVSVGSCYNTMAIAYDRFGDYDKAIHYYQLSLEYKKATKNPDRHASVHANMAGIFLMTNQIKKAKESIDKALTICEGRCEDRRMKHVLKTAADVYGELQNFDKAYKYLNGYLALRDSSETQASLELTKELEARFGNEKNQIIQEKLNAELEATALREKQQKSEIKQQRNILIFSLSGILVLGVMISFVFRANIRRKKINKELVLKNKRIEDQHNKIQLQKEELQEKNSEILDSINYAKRIQNAILPGEEMIKSKFKDAFVLYLPKDIVAGDFYWMHLKKNIEKENEVVLLAAADCTGHGVPGAMVSVVCNSGLNRSVKEYGLSDPGKILDKTRELVIEEFEKSEDEVKDGMDIALVSLEHEQNTSNDKFSKLRYSGAHNPLWLIRKGSNELEEFKANKQPIGKFDKSESYKTHETELKEGDTFYIFTDGFSDQFGGESGKAGGKKLKSTNFKKLLLSIQDMNMRDQKNKLHTFFDEWKKDLEQLDDICVIGIRL